MATVIPASGRYQALGQGLARGTQQYFENKTAFDERQAEEEKKKRMAQFLQQIRSTDDISKVRIPPGVADNPTEFLNVQTALRTLQQRMAPKEPKMEMVEIFKDGRRTEVPVDISSQETFNRDLSFWKARGYTALEPDEPFNGGTFVHPDTGEPRYYSPNGPKPPPGHMPLEDYITLQEEKRARQEAATKPPAGSDDSSNMEIARSMLIADELPQTERNLAAAMRWVKFRSAGDNILDEKYKDEIGGIFKIKPGLDIENTIAQERYPAIYFRHLALGDPISPERAARIAIEQASREMEERQTQQVQQPAPPQQQPDQASEEPLGDMVNRLVLQGTRIAGDAARATKEGLMSDIQTLTGTGPKVTIGVWNGKEVQLPASIEETDPQGNPRWTYEMVMTYLKKQYNMTNDQADEFIRNNFEDR